MRWRDHVWWLGRHRRYKDYLRSHGLSKVLGETASRAYYETRRENMASVGSLILTAKKAFGELSLIPYQLLPLNYG